MKAKITGVKSRMSYNGGVFYHIFFKGEDGKSYLTHAYPNYNGQPMRNFDKWRKAIELHNAGKEVELEGLQVLKGNTINADSGKIIGG